MAVTYGDTSASRTLEVTPSDARIKSISAPAAAAEVSGQITVTYLLESDLAVTASIGVQWSADGSSWSNATMGVGGDGTTGLTSSGAGTSHTYIWDSATDVGAATDTETYVRIRANDGAAWSAYTASSAFAVYNLPQVTAIASPASGVRVSGDVTISYTIKSGMAATASIDPEWSTNGSVWANTTMGTGGDGTTGLAISWAGNAHTYVWDSVTDVGSNLEDEVYVRIRVNDTYGWSPYRTSDAFTVDNLPTASSLTTPADNWFAKDTTPIFTFAIPTDPGGDYIHFKCDVRNTAGTIVLSRESNTTATGWEYWDDNSSDYTGKRYRAYYVQDLTVSSLTGTTHTFASLTDCVRATALPTSITGGRVMIMNKADRLCYVTSVTSSGFTIAMSAAGGADAGLVDVLVFYDDGSGWDEYWVSGYVVSSDTGVAVSYSDLTDDHSVTALPATITNAKIVVMSETDRQVVITSITNTGFTIRRAAGGADTAQVTLMILKTPADAYWITDYSVTSYDGTTVAWSTLTDALGGALPTHIPWPFVLACSKNGTLAYMSTDNAFNMTIAKSVAGEDTNASVDLMVFAPNVTTGFWVPMTTTGVPDAYEGAAARYTVQAADALAEATYTWTITAGNLAA